MIHTSVEWNDSLLTYYPPPNLSVCVSTRMVTSKDVVVDLLSTNRYSLTTLTVVHQFHQKDLPIISQFQYKQEVSTNEMFFDQFSPILVGRFSWVSENKINTNSQWRRPEVVVTVTEEINEGINKIEEVYCHQNKKGESRGEKMSR